MRPVIEELDMVAQAADDIWKIVYHDGPPTLAEITERLVKLVEDILEPL